ncbi:MAG: DinB family protein [Acidobacteriota bacterium]|nr:DinB family protein [Acidobacteriota bacterium]
MRLPIRLALAAALAVTALPAAAQQPTRAGTAPTGLTADLLTDIAQVEQKLVGLARAIPADKYSWRPGEGVRSVGEVLMHVAADNYLLPAALGHAAAPATGIKGDDYKTAQAYERRQLGRDSTIAELERSFAHLKKALGATPAARLTAPVALFGQQSTVQRTWLLTATHLHEHLGQLIAYARSNGVAPTWGQGG